MDTVTEKFLAASELLGRTGFIKIHVNPLSTRCSLPPHLRDKEHLIFDISPNFTGAKAIPDLCVDKSGVVATLSFGGHGFYRCALHWTAIWAITDESGTTGRIWVDEIPESLKKQFAEAQKQKAAAEDPESNVIPVDFKHRRKT